MLIGYARVSKYNQSLDRQLDSLEKAGCEKIFQEKITGTKKERPELIKMFDQLRQGDTVVISELARLGRSTKDLVSISEKLIEMKVELKSLKENIDTNTATGKMMFGMLAVLSQFERDLISESTKEGIESARSRGKLGGRPKKKPYDIQRAIKLYDTKEYTVKEIASMTKISRATIYNYIMERNKKI